MAPFLGEKKIGTGSVDLELETRIAPQLTICDDCQKSSWISWVNIEDVGQISSWKMKRSEICSKISLKITGITGEISKDTRIQGIIARAPIVIGSTWPQQKIISWSNRSLGIVDRSHT